MSDHGIPRAHAPGEVQPAPRKILWNGLLLGSLAVAPAFPDPAAAAFAGVSAAFILAVGHSVGMHRGVIHGAFQMSRPTRRAFAFLASLAGLGGPLTLLRMHETRDGHQNRPSAPDFYTFAHSAAQDAWWYLGCTHHGPSAPIPAADADDPWFQAIERGWPAAQLAIALALAACGGAAWVVWGAGVRCGVCVLGHWLVNYAAHTQGYRRYRMHGAGEEGRNHLLWGALAMGEGWHNNHHAWPDSARLGHAWWEVDPGWWVVRALAASGLIWGVKVPGRGATLRANAVEDPVAGLGDAATRSWQGTQAHLAHSAP